MTGSPDPPSTAPPAGAVENADAALSHLPAGFDVTQWTRAACESSGVPFGVTDPVTLRKLTHLIRHPA